MHMYMSRKNIHVGDSNIYVGVLIKYLEDYLEKDI